MSRNIDSDLLAAFSAARLYPVVLVMLTFRSETVYAWTGLGDLVWDGNTFKGVGSLGTVGDIAEVAEAKNRGTVLSLSGIDPTLLQESLQDIQLGAPAKIWYGALNEQMGIVGTPFLAFSGQMDRAPFAFEAGQDGAPALRISLEIQSRMVNHSRASCRRYTSADQAANGYADDSGFDAVELQNDIALRWGSS